jgi:SAM-dependent methyltransferase
MPMFASVSLAVRMISAVTIPPLYRLGERSRALRGRPVRRQILGAMKWLSRNCAGAARAAFASADVNGPPWLDPALLPPMIDHYARRRTRADRRLPHEKAAARAAEVLRSVNRSIDVGAGTRFLDLACGDGLVARSLHRIGSDVTACDVTACDLTDERYQAKEVAFVRADAANMPAFPDDHFDVVYTFDAFEHFADPAAVLKEVHRVLKPGGVLYASFGPLYHSPHGAHQFLSIDVPYCHLLFRPAHLNAAADVLDRPRITRNLNYWSLGAFRLLFDAQAERFETVSRFEKFNVAHVDLVRQYPSCFRAKVELFDELIVRSMEVLLRKRAD